MRVSIAGDTGVLLLVLLLPPMIFPLTTFTVLRLDTFENDEAEVAPPTAFEDDIVVLEPPRGVDNEDDIADEDGDEDSVDTGRWRVDDDDDSEDAAEVRWVPITNTSLLEPSKCCGALPCR